MNNLQIQKDFLQRVVRLDPKMVHPPKVSSRDISSFYGTDFDELKLSINSLQRNIQPILVRSSLNAPGHFDIVFGERRHRACLECEVAVEAIVDESLDDVAAFFHTVHENLGRRALSPLELGRQVSYGIARGFFKHQDDAAKQLSISKGAVSVAMAAASLPTELINAFRSADQLQYRFVRQLVDAVKEKPELVMAEARKIQAAGVVDPKEVFKRLVDSAKTIVSPLNIIPPVYIDVDGKTIGKLTSGKQGKVEISIDFTLESIQQNALFTLLQRFYKQQAAKPVKKRKDDEMTFKKACKQHDKLKIKLAAAFREIKAEVRRADKRTKLAAPLNPSLG